MKKMMICTLMLYGSVVAAGCGQKGALYLPDKNAAVVTRPGGASANGPEQPSPNTTAPALPTPGQGTSQQTPQNRAPEPPPPPTSEGTNPKPDKDKDESKSNSTPPR